MFRSTRTKWHTKPLVLIIRCSLHGPYLHLIQVNFPVWEKTHESTSKTPHKHAIKNLKNIWLHHWWYEYSQKALKKTQSLLQHDQEVQWFPWNYQAFQTRKAFPFWLDKMVQLGLHDYNQLSCPYKKFRICGFLAFLRLGFVV